MKKMPENNLKTGRDLIIYVFLKPQIKIINQTYFIMKKLSLLLAAFALSFCAKAQLDDRSIAPDFSLYEIDKTTGSIISTNPYTVYQYTDAGKCVFLDFFATWCGPCWNYHNTGAFESLYTQYGPDGTNEVMVFGIEGSNGNYASLSGTGEDAGGSHSYGNWLQGVEYPILPTRMSPNTRTVVSDYNIAYFPTIYMVCPNRTVFEVGQKNVANLYAATTAVCPQYDMTSANNAMLLKMEGFDPMYYTASVTETPVVTLQNVGDNALTSADFTITFDGQTTQYSWTGNLAKYATAQVSLPQVSTSAHGEHSYSVTLVNVNGQADADTVWATTATAFQIQNVGTTEDIDEDFSGGIPGNWYSENEIMDEYNGALYFYGYVLDVGTLENLYMPLMDLTRFQHPVLKFDVAYRMYNSSAKERLKVQGSTNLGTSYKTLYNKNGADLATVSGYTTSAYIPENNDWRTETVDLMELATGGDVSTLNSVLLRFVFTSGYGNIVWLDNVRVVEGVGIDDVTMETLEIYPNPTTGVLNINSPGEIDQVQILNLQGQMIRTENGNVRTLSLTDLSSGVYMLKVIAKNGASSMQKIVKE